LVALQLGDGDVHSFPTRRSSDLGSAFDLAVGVIIGAAFGSIVTSLVKDIVMPPISVLTGGLDFSNKFIVLKVGKSGTTSFTNIADRKSTRLNSSHSQTSYAVFCL